MSVGAASPLTWLIHSCALKINPQLPTVQIAVIILHNKLKPNVHRYNKASPQANTFHSSHFFVLWPQSSDGISSTYKRSTSGIGCLFAFVWFLFFPGRQLSESGKSAAQSVGQPVTPELEVSTAARAWRYMKGWAIGLLAQVWRHAPTPSALSGGLTATAGWPW